MTPEYLTCTDTNTQLEPFRRVIEAAVPTTTSSTSILEQREADLRHATSYNQLGQYIPLTRSTTSLENPYLRLTQEEYRTLRRYQEEKNLPERFLGATGAQNTVLYKPKDPPPANPTFQTTAQEYGKYNPNIHTMPYSYHGLSTKFTAKKTAFGNYRNHSLNL